METYEQNTAYPSDAEQNPEAVTPANHGQRNAVGTAAAGTVALGVAAYALSRLDDSDESDGDGLDSSLSGLNDGSGLNNGSNGNSGTGTGSSTLVLPVAQTDANSGKNGSGDGNLNLDDMTFEEAFAAARQAQGPGHHFTWHGGLYNTFYQEELDSMSMSERLAFVKTLDLPDDSDENEPAPARPRRAQSQHRNEEEKPVLADNHATAPPAPTVSAEPITVVPIATANANPEVVPLATDANVNNADLLTAESSTEQGSLIAPSIDSVDDHSHGSDDGHADASDDEVHFAY